MIRKPCIKCGKLTNASRCDDCKLPAQPWTERKELLYGSADYRKRSKIVRDTATHCWLCGEGQRINDPWQADHVIPDDPYSPLAPAHRSCNVKRANERRKTR